MVIDDECVYISKKVYARIGRDDIVETKWAPHSRKVIDV